MEIIVNEIGFSEIVNVLVSLAFIVGIFLLQIFLSRTESKWPGLVLPVITFLFSLLLPLNLIGTLDAGLILTLLLLLILGNLPTLILLAVYFVCREKYRKKNQMEMMKIQDLE